MAYGRLQLPQIPRFLFVIGLHVCAESGISETLDRSGWKRTVTFSTLMCV